MHFASLLVLVALVTSTVSAQFTVTSTNITHWLTSNTTAPTNLVQNGDMNNVVVGKPMTITIQSSSFHPFGIGFTNESQIVQDVNATLSAGCSNGTNTYFATTPQTAPCVLTITPPAALLQGSATGTIYYKCGVHPLMVGKINLIAAAVADSSSSSSTGAAPSSSSSSAVTLSSSTGAAPSSSSTGGVAPVADSSKYYVVGNTDVSHYKVATGLATALPAEDPSVTVVAGTTISFIITAVMPDHPFGFSTQNTNSSVDVPQGVTASGCADGKVANSWIATATSPCVLTVAIPADAVAQTVYYKCAVHTAMNGRINVVRPSSASTIVMSVATIVLAAITAIVVA